MSTARPNAYRKTVADGGWCLSDGRAHTTFADRVSGGAGGPASGGVRESRGFYR